MEHMVLYFRGREKAPAADRKVLRTLPGTRILDEIPGRVMLIEGDETLIREGPLWLETGKSDSGSRSPSKAPVARLK
jgi:hypothetical protein